MMQYPRPDDPELQPSEYPYSPMLGLGLMVWVLLVYLFVRDVGHLLGLLVTGARSGGLKLLLITSQNLIKDLSGMNSLQISLRSLGGVLLPVLLWAGFMLLTPKRGTSPLESLKLISAAGVLASLIGWVLLPLAYKSGQTAATEDVSLFLNASGWNGLLTGGLFALVTAGCYILARRRISSFGSLRDVLQGRASDLDYASNRGFYLATAGILILVIVVRIALSLVKV